MQKPLVNRLAVLTGGTRGIGKAIALRLVQEGAETIVTGTKEGGKPPRGCRYLAVDFTDRGETDRFIEKVSQLSVDILVNNAGVNVISPYAKIDPADFKIIHQVNVYAPFLTCRAVIPGMQQRKWGRIINISSVFGRVSKEFRASYSASKFALDGMTAALAAEVAADGILANCVAPGFINTELTRGVLGEKGMAEIVEKIPMGRLGNPEEIAALVTWLASPENTYISGQNIVIDGGFTRV